MHFSIRRGRKNQFASIDGPETLARQCGDFGTPDRPQAAGSASIPQVPSLCAFNPWHPLAHPLALNAGLPPTQPDPALVVILVVGTEPSVTRALLIERVIAGSCLCSWLD
jgi:hypothetical protein